MCKRYQYFVRYSQVEPELRYNECQFNTISSKIHWLNNKNINVTKNQAEWFFIKTSGYTKETNKHIIFKNDNDENIVLNISRKRRIPLENVSECLITN